MKRYKSIFKEYNIDVFKKYEHTIKVNPSKSDVNQLIHEVPEGFLKILRGLLYNDLYMWSAPDMLHETVREHKNIPKQSAALEFNFSDSPIEIVLSPTNQRYNKILSLPEIEQKNLIMFDPHITNLFGKYDLANNITSDPTYKAKFIYEV